jgi:chemotaxis regulatin CheY-phosphate phosphatase CheZ
LRERDRLNRVVAAGEVRRMLRALATPANAAQPVEPPSEHIRILRQELQEMSGYILQTRQEIAALRPDDKGNNRIMSATGELDAIVSATERATNEILKGAERIQASIARLPKGEGNDPIRQEVEGQVIEIMMACSFQDITGQRTSKVVNTLRYIEQRVNSMIEIWGNDTSLRPREIVEDTRPDAHLLNGPALEGGVSQDDVDQLMADFSAPPAGNETIDADAIDKLFA